jgi:hypothetical protein
MPKQIREVSASNSDKKYEISVEFIFDIFLTRPRRSRYSDWLGAGRSRGRRSSPFKVKNFLFSTSSRPALGSIQPPIQWVLGALSPRAKRPGREADHSHPASAEVKAIQEQLYLLHPRWNRSPRQPITWQQVTSYATVREVIGSNMGPR